MAFKGSRGLSPADVLRSFTENNFRYSNVYELTNVTQHKTDVIIHSCIRSFV